MDDKPQKYDVLIVGGAAAGMTAAIYTARRALKTLVLTKDIGGQLAITTEVENYPGTGTIMGPDLAERFKEQAEKSGAEIKFVEVLKVEQQEDKSFVLKTNNGDFQAPVAILCFGLEHRHLGIPGEKEFIGKGVTYCATCDGPLFKDKVVAVVGGGNSALDAAEYLSNICKKVYMFVRGTEFRGEQTLIEEVTNAKNVEVMWNTEVKEVKGEMLMKSVVLHNTKDDTTSDLDLQGLFIEIGWVTKTDFLKGMVEMDKQGFIVADNENRTSLPGLYAAGDVTDTPFKQAVISAGEGAKAALSAARYIKQHGGSANKATDTPDWTRRKAADKKKK